MKKSLLIAIVGIFIFAMASCSGGEQPKESKEFATSKAFLEKYEQAFENAETCEEMEMIAEQMEDEYYLLDEDNFDEKDRMTDSELEMFDSIASDWSFNVAIKYLLLGCSGDDDEE